MAVKSILDIEVKDKAFRDFYDLFAKYREEAKDLPPIFTLSEETAKGMVDSMKELTTAMREQIGLLWEQQKSQEENKKKIDATHDSLGKLYKTMDRIRGTVTRIAAGLLAWKTISSGISFLSGSSGFFGFDRLAAVASATRQHAGVLGLQPNELQAYQTSTARFPGSMGLVQNIQEMQTDVTQRWLLRNRLGFSEKEINTMSPAELAAKALPILRQKMLALPENMRRPMAEAFGFTKFMDYGGLTALTKMQPGEAEKAFAEFQKALKQFSLTGKTASAYDDFIQKLDTAKTKLQDVLITGLVKLEEPLGKLATSFTTLLTSLINSDDFKEGINNFAHWIEEFSKNIAKPETREAFKEFIHNTWEVAKGLGRMASWLAKLFHHEDEDHKTLSKEEEEENYRRFRKQDENLPPENGHSRLYNLFHDIFDKLLHRTAFDGNVNGAFFGSGGFGPSGLLHYTAFTGEQPTFAPVTGFQRGPWSGIGGTGNDNAYPEAQPFANFFSSLERQYHLPGGILASTMHQESRGNPFARSPTGALGAFQFMPGTAKRFGLSDPLNVEKSAEAAAKYYDYLLNFFQGDTEKAIAAYNAGEGRVKKAIERAAQMGGTWKNYIPAETQNYITKVHPNQNGNFRAPSASGVHIAIHNATGGNLVNVAASLAA